ncbi:MAG: methyltransferase domain-containing protein [Chthoniobacterales bacterium]|nr:methyltransferase domain-containing protein [Chthoniobacterales bacterium]
MERADEEFDQIFPVRIRKHSALHWTPVAVASTAARLLVTAPGTRVLDIGCGPGKFCLVGAKSSDGYFTGIEQRTDLVAVARRAATKLELSNVKFLRGNVLEMSFEDYDAFYLYNPFAENIAGHRIDATVPLTIRLFKSYIRYVASQLGRRPLGTRVVTYAGYADEIPACYDCEACFFDDDLKLWVKNREHDDALDELELVPARSYRGATGWKPPRELG